MKYVNDTGHPALDVITKAGNLWNGKYNLGLPKDWPRKKYSTATQLISPPQLAALMETYGDKLTMPITSGWWAMFGSILHQLLSEVDDGDYFQEWRLYGEYGGWKIGGQMARINIDTGVVEDYKMCSVWAYILGGKDEWEQQLNILAQLARDNGQKEITSLRNILIFRDWSATNAARQKGYPPQPFAVVEYPIWPPENARGFIERRVYLHQMARNGEVIKCTDDERWTKDECWAVHELTKDGKPKQTAKRLFRVKDHGTADEAREAAVKFIALDSKANCDKGIDESKYRLLHRPGKQTRCEKYCPVAAYCDQWRLLQIAQKAADGLYDTEAVKKIVAEQMIERKAV